MSLGGDILALYNNICQKTTFVKTVIHKFRGDSNIMKKTRHTYHYTVRRLKRNKTQAIKLKLAEKSNDSASFWQEIKKLNPNNSILPDIVDNANTDEDITNVFKEKYKEIYTSVPTDDMELETISQDINNLVLTSSNNDSCYITPSIVMSCITSLKSSKSDEDTGFNSNHLIHGTHRLSQCYVYYLIPC